MIGERTFNRFGMATLDALCENGTAYEGARVQEGAPMRLLLLLSAGMLVALLIGGGANMVRSNGCPELAREFASVSCHGAPYAVPPLISGRVFTADNPLRI